MYASVIYFNAGVENEETPRMNQQNVAKTPQNRLSVVSRLHYYEGTVSSKKLKNQKQHKICELFYSSLVIFHHNIFALL